MILSVALAVPKWKTTSADQSEPVQEIENTDVFYRSPVTDVPKVDTSHPIEAPPDATESSVLPTVAERLEELRLLLDRQRRCSHESSVVAFPTGDHPIAR